MDNDGRADSADAKIKVVTDDMMKRIAKEMLLSETAFVAPQGEGTFESSTRFLLRWFTPTKEVDLCGHGTLAAAAALALECNNSAASLDFETRSGTLTATRHGRGSEFELDFPSNPPHVLEVASPEAGVHREIARLAVGKQHAAAVAQLAHCTTTKKLVVKMDAANFGRAELEALDVPCPESLLAVKQPGTAQVTGVMVTVASEHDDFDFLSRYFAPWNGITEDPVTGAAHTVLAPFWARELAPLPKGENGESSIQLRARQCSPRGRAVPRPSLLIAQSCCPSLSVSLSMFAQFRCLQIALSILVNRARRSRFHQACLCSPPHLRPLSLQN